MYSYVVYIIEYMMYKLACVTRAWSCAYMLNTYSRIPVTQQQEYE